MILYTIKNLATVKKLLLMLTLASMTGIGTLNAILSVDIMESGGDVIFTLSGQADTADLSFSTSNPNITGQARGSQTTRLGMSSTDFTTNRRIFNQFNSSPSSGFGSNTHTAGGSHTGDVFALNITTFYLPNNYVSDTNLNATLTFTATSISAMGITTGPHTWTWGSSNPDSLVITVVPEAGEWATYAGTLALFGVVLLRLRKNRR